MCTSLPGRYEPIAAFRYVYGRSDIAQYIRVSQPVLCGYVISYKINISVHIFNRIFIYTNIGKRGGERSRPARGAEGGSGSCPPGAQLQLIHQFYNNTLQKQQQSLTECLHGIRYDTKLEEIIEPREGRGTFIRCDTKSFQILNVNDAFLSIMFIFIYI